MSQQTPLRLLWYKQVAQNKSQKEMKNLKFQQSPGGNPLHEGVDFVWHVQEEKRHRMKDTKMIFCAYQQLMVKLMTMSVKSDFRDKYFQMGPGWPFKALSQLFWEGLQNTLGT